MLIVEMHRIPKPADHYDLFDCPSNFWKTLRNLGESYGWKPSGTVPSPGHNPEKVEQEERKLEELRATVPPNWEDLAKQADEEARLKHEVEGKGRWSIFMGPGFDMRMEYSRLDLYEPRTWGDIIRMVTVDDARQWAEALERALQHMETLGIDLPHEGPGIINTTMHPELNELMNGGLKRDFVRAFIQYLKGGSFGFAWDD